MECREEVLLQDILCRRECVVIHFDDIGIQGCLKGRLNFLDWRTSELMIISRKSGTKQSIKSIRRNFRVCCQSNGSRCECNQTRIPTRHRRDQSEIPLLVIFMCAAEFV